ncbi:MAG TPA: hypothetical protein VF549_19495 [Solirubrobacteraceae bacterium]
MSSGQQQPAGLDRRDLLRLVGLIAALLAIVAVVLLAGGGGGGTERSTGQEQGVLTQVTETTLVLEPTGGGEPVTFTIRPQDRQRLDLFHLQTHAADALPSIVFYEQVGRQRYATRVDDAPVNP